jgi:hypothetical protein
MEESGGPHPAEAVRRARRRVAWIVGATVVLALAGGVFGASVLGPALVTHRHSTSHESGLHKTLAVAITVAVTLLVFAFVLQRRRHIWRDTMSNLVLQAGMSRSDRRQVSRSIRRGIPSSDPQLAATEHHLAARLVSQWKVIRVSLLVSCCCLLVAAALADVTTTGRLVFFGLIGWMLLACGGFRIS